MDTRANVLDHKTSLKYRYGLTLGLRGWLTAEHFRCQVQAPLAMTGKTFPEPGRNLARRQPANYIEVLINGFQVINIATLHDYRTGKSQVR